MGLSTQDRFLAGIAVMYFSQADRRQSSVERLAGFSHTEER